MRYFKILYGHYAGFIGTLKGEGFGKLVLFIQAQDQWILRYEKPDNLREIKFWGLNSRGYIEELI